MTIDSLKSSVVARLLFCCGIAVVSALLIGNITRLNPFREPEAADLITENGFKFESVVNDPELWSGPKVGFPLDTANLEDHEQKSLSNLVESENFTMLLAVDRECPICARSANYISEMKQQLAQRGIKYGFVSFKSDTPEVYFKYTKQLNADVPSYIWAHRNATVPSPLSLMIVPTHLLIDSQHRIRGIWPGGAQGELLRSKMTQQIVRDIDTLLAEKKSF